MRWSLGAAAWPTSCARHAPIRAQHSTSYHAPVLCDATIKYLGTDPAGTYADGTLGGGGHSEALLEVREGRVLERRGHVRLKAWITEQSLEQMLHIQIPMAPATG